MSETTSAGTLLPLVSRPGRYLGSEFNSAPTPASPVLSWALVFPDLYEIGMSHQGLQILYHIINNGTYSAERCYCPAPDAESIMRARHIKLTALESGRALTDFDVVGITLPHELCYTNILTIFDLAGIPFYAEDRSEDHPFIIGGGTCAFNAEPVAELFDVILVGDAEHAVIEISDLISSMKSDGASRDEIRNGLESVTGTYLPHRYKPRYKADGSIDTITPAAGSPPRVKRRVLPDLDSLDHLHHPLVPNAKIVHDRLSVEVARGCTRGCRFCQAGITYRPVRERSTEQIIELATEGIANSGFDEVSLLSLSTGDYSCLPEVLPKLMQQFADQKVSVAMPSMRVGTLTKDLMDQISKVRKTGFTLAPEAGSERLRQTINKGISEADLLEAAEQIFALGWNLIKLYFMIGLPTENDEDLEAIVELVNRTREAGQISGRGRKRISVSVGTFVPKPHTPFQWEPQLTIAESRKRLSFLKSRLHTKSVTLKYHDPLQSFLEGVFSRGDRRLTPFIIEAWNQGARLDSWSDYFNLDRWLEAADRLDIDLDFYLRGRTSDELQPWSHIDTLIEDEFLVEERDKGLKQEYTPDCRYHACQKCGICDFDTVIPVVHNRSRTEPETLPPESPNSGQPVTEDNHFRYLVSYSRVGSICYLGHLEFLQIIHRSLRRADIQTHFSHGFNPSPKIAFGPALPVGTVSHCEFFSMDLVQPLTDTKQTIEDLNGSLPPGMQVVDIRPMGKRIPQDIVSTYEIVLPTALTADQCSIIEQFESCSELIIERLRKGKTKQVDLRPLINRIEIVAPDTLTIDLVSRSGHPGTKPTEVLSALLQNGSDELLHTQVTKTAWSELESLT